MLVLALSTRLIVLHSMPVAELHVETSTVGRGSSVRCVLLLPASATCQTRLTPTPQNACLQRSDAERAEARDRSAASLVNIDPQERTRRTTAGLGLAVSLPTAQCAC